MLRSLWAWSVMVPATVGAALLSMVLCWLLPQEKVGRWTLRRWSSLLFGVAGIKVQVEGREFLADLGPAFFVGNHQSLLDIPALGYALDGRTRFLAKRALFQTPFVGGYLRRHEYVEIDRSRSRAALGKLNRALASLADRPYSYVIFAEGTRSKDGQLQPFKRGALKICQRAGLPVVPFAVIDTGERLRPGSRRLWAGTCRVQFAAPIPADEVRATPAGDLVDRVHAAVAEALGQPLPAAPTPAAVPCKET